MKQRDELRVDFTGLAEEGSPDPFTELGGRLVSRYEPPPKDAWQSVAVFSGLYPGSVDYHIGFPPPTEDNPGDLTVIVLGQSPFGKRAVDEDGKPHIEAQWLCGAYVFDGVHGMPDRPWDYNPDSYGPLPDPLAFTDTMSRVVNAVARDCLDGWRP